MVRLDSVRVPVDGDDPSAALIGEGGGDEDTLVVDRGRRRARLHADEMRSSGHPWFRPQSRPRRCLRPLPRPGAGEWSWSAGSGTACAAARGGGLGGGAARVRGGRGADHDAAGLGLGAGDVAGGGDIDLRQRTAGFPQKLGSTSMMTLVLVLVLVDGGNRAFAEQVLQCARNQVGGQAQARSGDAVNSSDSSAGRRAGSFRIQQNSDFRHILQRQLDLRDPFLEVADASLPVALYW